MLGVSGARTHVHVQMYIVYALGVSGVIVTHAPLSSPSSPAAHD